MRKDACDSLERRPFDEEAGGNVCLRTFSCDAPAARDPSHMIFSCTASGAMVALFCTPFDVVKNHWQFSPLLESKRTTLSTRAVVRDLIRTRGLRSLWTGLVPTVGLIVPSNIIFFSVFERLKETSSPAYAGSLARLTSVVVTNPLELLRTRVQANVGGPGPRSVLKSMIESGTSGFWRGTVVTLMRDLPFSAVYWTIYERLRVAIARNDARYTQRSYLTTQFAYPFATGAISAGVSCVLTHPIDVIKTTTQAGTQSASLNGQIYEVSLLPNQIGQSIYKAHGLAGFWVGLVPRLIKIVPSCAILLGTYELSRHLYTAPDKYRDW